MSWLQGASGDPSSAWRWLMINDSTPHPPCSVSFLIATLLHSPTLLGFPNKSNHCPLANLLNLSKVFRNFAASCRSEQQHSRDQYEQFPTSDNTQTVLELRATNDLLQRQPHGLACTAEDAGSTFITQLLIVMTAKLNPSWTCADGLIIAGATSASDST